MSEFVFEDPGAGRRLGEDVRTALAKEIRAWRRAAPGAVLLRVLGDAWHHAPEVGSAPLDRDRVAAGYQALVKDLFGLACPVVAALDGEVSGFGLALALAADVRLATARTTLAVGDLKAAALLGGTGWLLGRAAGTGTFAQLAWTGETLPAGEAARRGLLSPGDGDAARALADRLAADPAGSSALKRALSTRQRGELETVLAYESWLADVAAGGAG
ncbi:enoyl-CoA hydratase-related protein [Amycolatopsis sp. FDAARGOS 1241]|uniref:enoyl-CoA hydratase-related protein n=1 Tax=Amycolatopsis sp. FDAARGOS 1241 TaxID=2778070 RepID=UPI00194E3FB9|nr:enoyl-CoA hydratase-related protein [Amycolatopsis sp. FDAARGOS 1241]QRP43148.1 enoyl-CoA hydratase/isomerase family protein [Amycolatopsis sp. FDAARGOS 1241]